MFVVQTGERSRMAEQSDHPARIGPYRVLGVLGTGGFSHVYRVVREGGGGFRKELALKVLAPDVEPTQDMAMMMADEARIARHLHHRNIVAVHEFGEADGVYWLLMDLVQGVDLRSVLAAQRANRGWLPLPVTVEVVYRVLHGLHYAHGRRDQDGQRLGIVHRDLTPGNVLLGRDGQVRVSDFGLARIRTKIAETQAGITRGTAHYMSPEQAQGRAIDHRSDQFAVGVLLYLLVSAALPFPGTKDASVMRSIVRGTYPPVRASGVPDSIVAVIERMLAPLPADRYPDALAAAEALVNAVPVAWRVDAERILGRLVVRAEGVSAG
jgi:eukaryotic-like serine/threonine-protein kinase